jgi:hypothetical protein
MDIINENIIPISIIGVILLILVIKKITSKPETGIDQSQRLLSQQNKHASMFGLQEIEEPNDKYGKLSQLVSRAYTQKQRNVTADYIDNLKNELTSVLKSIGNHKPNTVDDFINNLGCKVTSS